MEWTQNNEVTWWIDLVTMRRKKSGVDKKASSRGVLLQKIVQTAVQRDPADMRFRDDGEWIVKTRLEWAQLCRVNYPTVDLRLIELKKLGLVTTGRQRDLNGSGNLALSIKVLWPAIEKRVQEMTKAA